MLICCLLLGCGDVHKNSDSSEEDTMVGWMEEKITLSADSVSISEDDYAEIKGIQKFIRDTLIDNTDTNLLDRLQQDVRELIGEEHLNRDGRVYYLSCVPIISWNYEQNTIDCMETGLYIFNENNAYILYIDKESLDKGELSISGLYSMNLTWMKSGNGKYIWTKADYYTSCFVGADNVGRYEFGEKYPADLMEIIGDYYGKFDDEKIGVSFENLTNLSNCIKVVLSDN